MNDVSAGANVLAPDGRSRWQTPVRPTSRMIAAPEAIATEAGADVLARGGNAIDAAVTCAFVQGVVNPHDAGLGGFALLTIQRADESGPRLMDAPALAGSRATADMWAHSAVGPQGGGWGYRVSGRENESGYTSICTPGSVRGLATMLERWGTINLADAIEPAAEIAERGFVIDERIASYWRSPSPYPGMPDLLQFVAANAEAARIYLGPDGSPPRAGDVVRNPDYATTLREIGRLGADSFYEGDLARRIANDLLANGAFVTLPDLTSYEVRDRPPEVGTYRGHVIVTAPAPHCGPALLEILNIVEGWDLRAMGHNTPTYVRHVSMAMKAAFDDRARYLGDPAFGEVPIAWMISKERADWWRSRIDDGASIGGDPARAEAPGTTHVSVVDRDGTCVSLTHSLGGSSGVISPGLGFMYNNSMFNFDPVPGRANSIAPGKGRITGMAPTIVYRDGVPVLAIGAPGATRIVTAIAQVILNRIDFDMDIQAAVFAPRFHAQGDMISCQIRVPESVCREVRMFHPIRREAAGHGAFALVHAVEIDPRTGRLTGAADAGSDGMAIDISDA